MTAGTTETPEITDRGETIAILIVRRDPETAKDMRKGVTEKTGTTGREELLFHGPKLLMSDPEMTTSISLSR